MRAGKNLILAPVGEVVPVVMFQVKFTPDWPVCDGICIFGLRATDPSVSDLATFDAHVADLIDGRELKSVQQLGLLLTTEAQIQQWEIPEDLVVTIQTGNY